jgi:type II secretory pathway pseudopilin PulG
MKKLRGLTIIELIVSMGILTVLISILMAMLSSIIGAQLDAKATSSVDQDGRYILARLAYDMQSAASIASPSAGLTGGTLKIKINSIDYTYNLDSNSNLQVTNNNGTDVLNSSDTSVSSLTFQRIGAGGNNDTIKMSFTVTGKTRKTTGVQYETKTFKTTLGRHSI